jgi:hypothetical protein
MLWLSLARAPHWAKALQLSMLLLATLVFQIKRERDRKYLLL